MFQPLEFNFTAVFQIVIIALIELLFYHISGKNALKKPGDTKPESRQINAVRLKVPATGGGRFAGRLCL